MLLNWTNISSPGQLLQAPNVITGNWFWVMILFTLVIIVFVTLLTTGWEIAMLTASFVGMVATFFLVFMDFVDWKFSLMFVGLFILMLFLIYYSAVRPSAST